MARKPQPARPNRSACRVCGQIFSGVTMGQKAPVHKYPGTDRKCPGSGNGTFQA